MTKSQEMAFNRMEICERIKSIEHSLAEVRRAFDKGTIEGYDVECVVGAARSRITILLSDYDLSVFRQVKRKPVGD